VDRRAIGIFFWITAVLVSLPAFEETLVMGREDGWSRLEMMDGVVLKQGQEGFPDLFLRDGEYSPESSAGTPDLILHFNGEGNPGAGYVWEDPSRLLFSSTEKVLGEGALAFNANHLPAVLRPRTGALLSAGTSPRNFTLEFWVYPARLSQGEAVFSWEGAWKGEGYMLPQSLSARFSEQRLVWTFRNFFLPAFGGQTEFVLRGNTRLLPRVWHHHLIRYDSLTGLLEYLIDGVPEAVVFTTSSGREAGEIYLPECGSLAETEITLGNGLVGLLDELRLSSRIIADPQLDRYRRTTGSARTGLLDLGPSGARLVRIDTRETLPSDSAVYYFYRFSPRMFLREDDQPGWTEFRPGEPLETPEPGRYLQLMIQLLPDGTASRSPRVSSLSVVYEPQLPPLPPSYVLAEPENGSVLLQWNSLSQEGELGYRIYFGDKPGDYFGTSSSGSSPLDAGSATSFRVKGLENGRLYFFSVVTYSLEDPSLRSEFSREVSARPSRFYGDPQ